MRRLINVEQKFIATITSCDVVGSLVEIIIFITFLVGYPLDSPSPNRLWFALSFAKLRVHDPITGNRINGHGLLHQTIEKLASALRPATIEAERKLIQIVVQVLGTDRPLVGAQQPSFE